jgi:hypothetical protein
MMGRNYSQRKKTDQMMDIVHLYLEAGGEEPFDLETLAKFAMVNGHWERGNADELRLQMCKREFSRAFREQHHRDPQKREVRTYHAVQTSEGNGKKIRWGDMRKEPPEHMEVAFQQRRSQIVGDCTQLRNDVDSYNDNNAYGACFQLELDFTEDAAERLQPTKYQPAQPR